MNFIQIYHEGIFLSRRFNTSMVFLYPCLIQRRTHMDSTKTSLNPNLKKLIISGLCLALCMLLPFLTGQIPQIGSALAPMHIPVLICGLICGWPYGLAVGLIAPLLRSLTLGMPPLFPVATAMAFEMAAYGAAAGLLLKFMPKKTLSIYMGLIGAMIIGRLVWGVAMFVCMGINGGTFTFQAFLAGAFLNAIPGIICHILIIPPIVLGLRRAKLTE